MSNEPLVLPADFFIQQSLAEFNTEKKWYTRLHLYQQRFIINFRAIHENDIARGRMALATRAILEYYNVATGHPLEVARCIRDYGTNFFGYAMDPIKYEWFASPLALVGMANKRYPKFDDCDGHSVAIACMLASVGIEPFLTFLAIKVPFMFGHVLTSIIYNGEIYSLETINKTNAYPFPECPPWLCQALRNPYSEHSHLYLKPEVSEKFKLKEYYHIII
jgi:hypothetical protein